MATKTAFTLEDPFAEKVNDDYAQLTWANEQIYSVADGKHSLLSHILKGDIKVEKSKWGLTGTYDQSAPIRTTRAMVKQLLRDEHIDLDRLKQILSGGQEDETSAAKFVRSLTDAAKTPHRSPKTAETQKIGEDDIETTQAAPPKSFKELWDESTETYPFITKMILTCENPENRELRKSKRQFCVYEFHIGGAFTDLKTAEQKVVKDSGYVPEDVLNEAMRSINTIVSKKVAKETLKKARFTDAVTSKQLHGYEIFKLLQKPSDNNLRNILHVSDAITDLERESKTPSAHWTELLKRAKAFDTVVSSMSAQFSFGNILALAIFVRSMLMTDVQEQSIKNDIMKLDSTSATIDEVTTIIRNHEKIDLTKEGESKQTEYDGVTMMAVDMYYHAMKAGFTRKCFACNDTKHVLADCPYPDKIAEFRRAKPEIYEKFKNNKGTKPKPTSDKKCRYGDQCRRNKVGKCPFKHDESNSANKAEERQAEVSDNYGGFVVAANETWEFATVSESNADYYCTTNNDNSFSLYSTVFLMIFTLLTSTAHVFRNFFTTTQRRNEIPQDTKSQEPTIIKPPEHYPDPSITGNDIHTARENVLDTQKRQQQRKTKTIAMAEGCWNADGKWSGPIGSGGKTTIDHTSNQHLCTENIRTIMKTCLIVGAAIMINNLPLQEIVNETMNLCFDYGYLAVYGCAMALVGRLSNTIKHKAKTEQTLIENAYPCIAYQGDGDSTTRAILDSGANIHMTGSKTGLTNQTESHVDISTANGIISCNQKGDKTLPINVVEHSPDMHLKNVVYNPNLKGDLVSVYQLCAQSNTPKAVVLTKHGAWSCPAQDIQKVKENFVPIAKCTTKGTYICSTTNDKPPSTGFSGNTAHTPKRSGLNLYSVQEEERTHSYVGSNDVSPKNTALTWHQRLGHVSVQAIKLLTGAKWITIPKPDLDAMEKQTCLCKGCLLGAKQNHKHPRKPTVQRNLQRPATPGSDVHIDLFKLPANSKYPRALCAVDSSTAWSWLIFLPSKNAKDVIPAIKKLFATIKSDGYTPQRIYADIESAIKSKQMDEYFVSNNITWVPTKDSQQNLSETKTGKLRTMAKKLILDRHLSDAFWVDAFRYANQISLVLPHTRLGMRTPYQEYRKRSTPTDILKRFRIFGSICYFHNTQVTTKKHDPTTELIFTGFKTLGGPYIAVNPKKQGHIHNTSWHALFDETYKANDWLSKITEGRLLPIPQILPRVHEIELQTNTDTPAGDTQSNSTPMVSQPSEHAETPNTETRAPSVTQPTRSSSRATKGKRVTIPYHDIPDPGKNLVPTNITMGNLPPQQESSLSAEAMACQTFVSDAIDEFHSDDPFLSAEGVVNKETNMANKKEPKRHRTLIKPSYPKANKIKTPKTLREAQKSSYWPEFEIAIKIENENLTDHQTFEILQDDPHKHKLGTKYVFAIKSDQNGEITRFKARLVAQGYNQIPGLEFGKSYAPVAKMSTILILMVLAVTLNMAIKLLDFKGAFLHSYMPDEYPVYIKTPHGFDIGPNHMLKLRKSLYGTRNAGYLWYEDLRAELLRQGFQQSIHDQCLFSRTKNGHTTYLATWVDDVIVVSNDPKIDELLTSLKKHNFDIQTFENLDWYLGLSIQHDRKAGILKISQEAYIDTLLEKFNMTNCNTCDTPMVVDPPNKSDCPEFPLDKPYRQLLGALAHIARFSRPDILFAVFYLARYQQNPGEAHWKALKRILRYLKGTKSLALTFRRGETNLANINLHSDKNTSIDLLQAFTDADWAGDKDERKSTSGYVITLNDCPILSKSTKQKATAQSTCESESMALARGVTDVIWVRNLLRDLLGILPAKTPVYCDNQSTIDISKNDRGSDKCKHIAITHNFLQENEGKTIDLLKIPTKDNIADLFTKPLPRRQFETLRDRLFGLAKNPFSTATRMEEASTLHQGYYVFSL